MKNVFEHIEYVKGKPHHFRRRIAAVAATVGSALIAVAWLTTSYMTGAFAIQGSSFAMSTAQEDAVATTSASDTQGFAGAAAAFGDTRSPARIEIVDAAPAQAPAKKIEPTILPF